MKIVSWNCNGIRSVMGKKKDGSKTTNKNENVVSSIVQELKPDIVCFQEVKCSQSHSKELDEFKESFPFVYINCANKQGYSGVAVMSNVKPKNVYKNFELLSNEEELDFLKEGRVLTLEFDKFFLINCYTVNSKAKLERLEQRINEWEPMFRKYIKKLGEKKDVVVVGDLNVAPQDIDIHTVKGHTKSAGFTIEEKTAFADLLTECKLVDAYRTLYPKKQEYTYFSNFAKSRERNKGWRIDHVLLSSSLKKKVTDVSYHKEFFGSDHIVVSVDINV
jgi:exodeoxyribonuclease-3